MLGMQDDISDIELKQRWRLYWIHTVFEFSNLKLQKKSWTQESEDISNKEEEFSTSFEECSSSYFDNLALFNGYDKALKYGNVSLAEAQNADTFHQLLYMYDEPSENPEEIFQDGEWLEVVEAAKIFWNYLKENVSAQREIDLIKKLEMLD